MKITKSAPWSLGILFLLSLSQTPLSAQEGVNVRELARQIHRNMLKVEESLEAADNEAAGAAAKQAARDLKKLIKPKARDKSSTSDQAKQRSQEITRRGQQVVKDIEAIIKAFKSSGGGQGQGRQQQSSGKQKRGQKSPESRDRNRSERQKGKKPGQQKKKSRKPRGAKEDNRQKNPPGGRNQNANRRPPQRKEDARFRNLEGKWGLLPPEKRQRLVDRNFKDFTPEYEREIKAYFKKILKER